MDTRNVADKFREWETELVREHLVQTAFPYAVMMTQISRDFNFGSVIRNANIFGASEIFYFGHKKIDRRGAVGAYLYSKVTFLESMEALKELKKTYSFVAAEQNERSVRLKDFIWPSKPLILIGEEGCGLSEEMLQLCDNIVEIPQYGSVRSLNASTASGIVMYDYVSKHT